MPELKKSGKSREAQPPAEGVAGRGGVRPNSSNTGRNTNLFTENSSRRSSSCSRSSKKNSN